jgi:DNA-binding NtrC family response regulator
MPDLIFLAMSSCQSKHTTELIQTILKEQPDLPVVALIEDCQPDETFALLELGVADFIMPPFKATTVLPRFWRLIDKIRRNEKSSYLLKEKLGLQQLIGESPMFQEVIRKIPLVAKCDASVLVYGDTGTGKELCARAIHYLSPRVNKSFIPVTCGAIPMELMENELFGHIKGAYTGASSSNPGLIQEADGGTLFLDDIDCLPFAAQGKLLRFLQEKEYRQLGSTKIHHADVRVISTTNRELENMVDQGKFRKDLYFRLNIVPLKLPLLRERREDIPPLAHHFLEKYAEEFDKQVNEFTPQAMEKLLMFEWPGNVRELEHVVERAVVLSEAEVIQATEIILHHSKDAKPRESFKEAKARVVAQFERSYIQGLLLAHHGNITRAARAAQKNPRAFWQLIYKHQIDVQSFRSK